MALEALSPLGSITVGGKTYPFAPYDALGVRAMFEDWMIREGDAQVQRFKAFQTPAKFEETEDRFRRDVSAKLYCWGTKIWSSLFDTLDGQKELVRCQLAIADPKTPAETIVEAIYALPREERGKIVNAMFDWAQDPNQRGGVTPP